MRFIAPSGSDVGGGTQASTPLRTLGYALSLAQPGDVLVLATGVYREGIETSTGGRAGAPITIRAAAGAQPVVSGSVQVTAWANLRGAIWSTPWSATQLGPEGCSGGECPMLPRGAPQQVFVDGVPLQQVAGILPAVHPACPSSTGDWCREVVGASLTELDTRAGAFFFDSGTNTLFIRLANDAPPAGHLVEVALQRRVLFFYPNAPGHLCIEGLTFRHNNASAAHRQMAGVTLLGNTLLSNSIVEQMDLAGVATSGTVSRCLIRDNGQLGLSLNSTATLEHSVVARNNRRHFNPYWEAGGMKVVTNQAARIEGCHVFDNDGVGIWLDGSSGSATASVTVARNWVHGNGREGQIMVELSNFATVVNNVVWNDGRVADENVRGLYVSESSDVLVAFNTVVSTAPTFEFDALSGSRGTIERLQLENNVLASFAPRPTHANVRISAPTAWQSDFNAFFRQQGPEFEFSGTRSMFTLQAWRTATSRDASSIETNPLFVDVAARDFRPSPASPLRGAGRTNARVLVDFSGRQRPASPDPGAFQHCP